MTGTHTRVSSDLQVPHKTDSGGRRGTAGSDVALPTVDDTFREKFTNPLQRKYPITSHIVRYPDNSNHFSRAPLIREIIQRT